MLARNNNERYDRSDMNLTKDQPVASLLQVGGCADIAVFQDSDEGFRLQDSAENCLQNDHGFRCMFTVADGRVVYRAIGSINYNYLLFVIS